MFLLYLIIIVIFLLDISNVINLFSNNIIDLSTSNYTPDIPNGNSTTQPTDPVRYWPSGVPQNVRGRLNGYSDAEHLIRITNILSLLLLQECTPMSAHQVLDRPTACACLATIIHCSRAHAGANRTPTG